ncbi:MAG: exodeoxyribonuclease III [Bradymonadia bacterium]
MFKVATWNVNSLRSALKKGFEAELAQMDPDVIMLQEVRALEEQLPGHIARPTDWHVAWNPAEKKGYSGVGIWSKHPIDEVTTGMTGVGGDYEADPEGRVIRVRTAGMQFICTYLPSGTTGGPRQTFKEDWMAQWRDWLKQFLTIDEPVIVAGDLNIAHTANDIHNPTGNKKTSGFLPHERDFFSDLLGDGWTDALRALLGDQKGPYTWWSMRGRARELDRGWRIDYLLCNAAAASRLEEIEVRREAGITISDHAPQVLTLKD